MIYSESDLIVPTLAFLSAHKTVGLTTSQLIQILSEELDLSQYDLASPPSRNDSRFSQKVRNLLSSHRILERKGLATYEMLPSDGLHKITPRGERYLTDNANSFDFIIQNAFTEEQRKEVIDRDFSNLVIEEGFTRINNIKTRQRSKRLVAIARKHYARKGTISCHGCNFNFGAFYGDIGEGFIEIHHLKPIFTYERNIAQSLKDALKNVRPVCSNCHRMIHRDTNSILSVPKLQVLVRTHGVFEIGATE